MYYNRRREPAPIFTPGDKVWLDRSNIATNRPSSKLSHCQLGPFAIEARVGHGVYCLVLPPQLQRLHPIFPVVKLSIAVRGHPSVSLPPLSSPTLPLFICILPTPLYHLQGPHPKADDLCIQSPTTFRRSTHQRSSTSRAFLRSYLNNIRRVLDTLG
jgi:hypothetical protein